MLVVLVVLVVLVMLVVYGGLAVDRATVTISHPEQPT